MDIGDRIKQLREQQGMTLEELGNKVGVGKSTVRKWETGMIENMRRDKIAKVAAALNVTPDYLIGWKDGDNAYELLLETYKNNFEIEYIYKHLNLFRRPEIRVILECLETCDPEQFRMIYQLATAFKARNDYLQTKENNNGKS